MQIPKPVDLISHRRRGEETLPEANLDRAVPRVFKKHTHQSIAKGYGSSVHYTLTLFPNLAISPIMPPALKVHFSPMFVSVMLSFKTPLLAKYSNNPLASLRLNPRSVRTTVSPLPPSKFRTRRSIFRYG